MTRPGLLQALLGVACMAFPAPALRGAVGLIWKSEVELLRVITEKSSSEAARAACVGCLPCCRRSASQKVRSSSACDQEPELRLPKEKHYVQLHYSQLVFKLKA